MADPFSVAGTAVGITSLGIQTCQILYNYYSKYKGYHDDIDNVLRQVEGLQGILESLRYVKDRFEIDNHVPSSQLHIALKACEDALARLKTMADKCNTTERTGSIQSRLRDVKKRLIWPYRKETLADMQASLSGFRDNLSLALQCAGFDGVARKVDDLHPRLNYISHQATNMEQSLFSQSSVLEVIHRGVTEVSRTQHQHDMTLSREMRELRDHVSACMTIAGSKMELVARSVSSLHDPALVVPSILADAIQTLGAVQPHVQSSLESYDTHSLELEKASANEGLLPLCRCRTKRKQSFQRQRWMSILSAETYQHDRGCALFAFSNYKRSVVAQFRVYNKFVGVCIEVGWKTSKGWTTIAPMLRCRAVVPRHTGAFKIFNDGMREMRAIRWINSQRSVEKLREILLRTIEKLQVSLGIDFDPLDVNEDGDGILHAALSFMHAMKRPSDLAMNLMNEVKSLLDLCLTRSVPFDQLDAFGFTPIVRLQYYMALYSLRGGRFEILRHLARRTGDWSLYVPNYAGIGHKEVLYDSWSEVLKSEELTSALNEDDQLYLAIVRRSEIDLCKFLTTHDREETAQTLEQPKHCFAMAAWPECIEILVVEGLANNAGGLATALWRAALRMHVLTSAVALLSLKLHVTKRDWSMANYYWLYDKWTRAERTQWAEIFDTLACLLSPRNDLLPSFQDCGSSDVGKTEVHLYNCQLSVLSAESLWKFGHRNLNSVRCRFAHDECHDLRHYHTPLWSNAYFFDVGRHELLPSIFRWLLEHGADGSWIHPVFLTTPFHVLVRSCTCLAIRDKLIEPLESIIDLLVLERPDSCVCYCSLGGCRVLGSAALKSNYAHGSLNFRRRARKEPHRVIQPYIFQLVQKNCTATWMSSAILRLITFEELSLTHTCCYRVEKEVNGVFYRPTPEEAKVIYELEREDIELLENLTTEFELKWATYTKPFVTFMNRVWKPRMRAIRAESRVDKDIYEAELQRIGVTLKQADEEEAEDLDTDSEPESDPESEFDSDKDWPDDYESERDGWYTTDEEDGGVEEEDENADEEADQPTHDVTDDGLW